jgi:hypothetical protein
MNLYQLTDSDKAAFKRLGDIDSRAFIITMIAVARSDITRLLKNPPESTKEEVLAQLATLGNMALDNYGIVDFKEYLDASASAFAKDSANRANLMTLRASLEGAEKIFRRIDGEGQGSGWAYHPEAPERTRTPEQSLNALQTTPLYSVGTKVNAQFIKVLVEQLQHLSVGQLHQLKDFCTGESRRTPHVFTEMFGSGLGSQRLQTLKSVVNACIVPSRSKGLTVETDVITIQKSLAYSNAYSSFR